MALSASISIIRDMQVLATTTEFTINNTNTEDFLVKCEELLYAVELQN